MSVLPMVDHLSRRQSVRRVLLLAGTFLDSGVSFKAIATPLRGSLRLERSHRAVVLLDMVTPEKDGIETLREFLRRRPGTPVITLSGRGGACEHNETAQILGAVASFRKPFHLAEVLGAIRKVLAAAGCVSE